MKQEHLRQPTCNCAAAICALLVALLLGACGPTAPRNGPSPGADATATRARAVIEAALAQVTAAAPVPLAATGEAGTPAADAGAGETTAPAPARDAAATSTAQAQEMATAVAATLTAQPTATPDATATAAAATTALAAEVARSVGATLTAEARSRPSATPTPQPTATPIPPTLTATPVAPTPAPPTSTPTRAPAYHFISLAAVANNSTQEGYINPPQGEATLGGVPFSLPPGTNSVTTQADSLPDNPVTITLGGLGIANPRAVYLLVTGGNTRAEFRGVPVGEVRLIFAGGEAVSMALVPGANLREWKSYGTHNVTTVDAPELREVWSGANHFDNAVATIDMLTVSVPAELQGQTLAAVELADRSQEWAGSRNPAINLIGVTVLAP